jgi:hypothetical protein
MKKIILTAAVFMLILACENPVMVNNMRRPVYLSNITVHTNVDPDETTTYMISPIFDREATGYEVKVPAGATEVYINAVPEEGALVEYIDSQQPGQGIYSYTDTGAKIVQIKVKKTDRVDTIYTVSIERQMPPQKLSDLQLMVGFGGSGPEDLAATYEPENFIINFAPSGLLYPVKVPYYTEYVLIKPQVEFENVGITYELYYPNDEDKLILEQTITPSMVESHIFDFRAKLADPAFKKCTIKVITISGGQQSGMYTLNNYLG